MSSSLANLAMASPRPWADLPDDIVKTLVGYLLPNFFDVLSLEAVCKSWRAATAALRSHQEVPHRPRGSSLPCLTYRAVQAEPSAAGGCGGGDEAAAASSVTPATTTTRRCFHSLANDRVYCGEVPDESRDWDCWGSSHGCLLMMDRRGCAFLFDPITGARVGLPPVTTLPGVVCVGRKKRDGAPLYILFCPRDRFDPTEGISMKDSYRRFTADDLRHHFLRKVVLSSSPSDPGCIAVVIHTGTLLYARPGDGCWTELENPWNLFKDVTYHDKEGRFYALSAVAGVLAIDFPSSEVALFPHDDGRLLQPTMKLVAPRNACISFDIPQVEYLVALPSGEILHVCRYVARDDPTDDDDDDNDDVEHEDDPGHGDNRSGGNEYDSDYELGNEDREYSSDSDLDNADYVVRPYQTANFKVFLLNTGGEGQKNTNKHWMRLHSIGECSLFLGFNQSMSLPASGEAMGKYKPNCIYFTDDIHQVYSKKPYCGHDCGIFEIGKQTVEFFPPPDGLRIMPPPMWIMPNR